MTRVRVRCTPPWNLEREEQPFSRGVRTAGSSMRPLPSVEGRLPVEIRGLPREHAEPVAVGIDDERSAPIDAVERVLVGRENHMAPVC
jgi:hypothetical protein